MQHFECGTLSIVMVFLGGTILSDKTKLSVILYLPANLIQPVAKVQDDLCKRLNNVTKKDQDFHVTIAVAEGINKADVDEIVSKLRPMLANVNLSVKVGPIDSLENRHKEGVLYLKAESDDLKKLYKQVRTLLESYGGKFFYPSFKGHITMCYLDAPVTAEQKKNLPKYESEISLSSNDVRISTKESDDAEWVRIAWLKLSKRIIAF